MTEISIFWLKLTGAALGSSIAVVFKTGGDPWLKLAQRFVLGTIIGFIAAPLIIDYMEWKHSRDFWIAAATLGGVSGYLTLQIVFSKAALNSFKKKVNK